MPAQEDPAESGAGDEAGESAQVQADASPVASSEQEQRRVAERSDPAGATGTASSDEAASPPVAAEAPRRVTSLPASGWMVQVGSFASRDNAERLSRDLKAKGFVASVSESRGGGRNLYRVRVGPEADRGAAQAVLARLRARGVTGAAVVPYP